MGNLENTYGKNAYKYKYHPYLSSDNHCVLSGVIFLRQIHFIKKRKYKQLSSEWSLSFSFKCFAVDWLVSYSKYTVAYTLLKKSVVPFLTFPCLLMSFFFF